MLLVIRWKCWQVTAVHAQSKPLWYPLLLNSGPLAWVLLFSSFTKHEQLTLEEAQLENRQFSGAHQLPLSERPRSSLAGSTHTSLILEFQRHSDLWEFKASLIYISRVRLARATKPHPGRKKEEKKVEVENSSFFGKLMMSNDGLLGHTGEKLSC